MRALVGPPKILKYAGFSNLRAEDIAGTLNSVAKVVYSRTMRRGGVGFSHEFC